MASKNKINSLIKINDEDSMEHPIHVTTNDLNSEEPTEDNGDDLKIVFIPKNLHDYFECVVGKHVFVDKPWTKISHKKIIDHIQCQNSNSCFWKFRKNLENIKNDEVLVGYKPFSSTDEEFLICTTDKAKQYIDETQTQMEFEIKPKMDQLVFRVPGPWESKSSEKDIEEIKPVQTRGKITYKLKLKAGKLQTKADFEDSNSKSIKNEYVKLEPRPKEIFESSDILSMDSSVQAVRKMIDREMQTIPRIKDNKCIQSVAIEEEMFQLQPLTKPNKALDDFLERHVPNLVEQLHYNELYDLYRDDYKLLNNTNQKSNEENAKNINLLPGYQNLVSPKKHVSCHTWHPTIPGVFAVSYMTNSNASYKSVSLEPPAEEMTKSTVKDEKYGISHGNDENNLELWNNQTESKFVVENYKENIISLLNNEFVQRMRIIQITEDEKTNEHSNQDMIKQLRNILIYISHEQPSTNTDHLKENLDGEIIINDKVQSELTDQCEGFNLENEISIEENEYEMKDKSIKKPKNSTNITAIVDINESEEKCIIDHHDSDTESFYNIWGDDEEWLYGNEMRNVVRDIHRNFNKKYDREAREKKLFSLLKSEAKYTEKKKKIKDMEKERIKLTKDMFEAGDIYKKLNHKQEYKSKKKRKSLSTPNKQHKIFQNNDEPIIKQQNIPLFETQNNCVVIWSVNDNIFPKLKLESPEEVCCVEFNPINGNTVVGGLTNGQICIWDINRKLETIDSSNTEMSNKEKNHHRLLWMHMQWSLDINFKTRIRPAALSAILESHESMVTAIQWIHPINEITPSGKLVTMQEGKLSNQFMSASMDGTIKLWDLQSTPLTRPKRKSKTKTCSERPKNLQNYKSPLNIYNNRLKPSYTIIITEPGNVMSSPITALSFEIPLMQYKFTSNAKEPIVIGKRQFEYVPRTHKTLNRIIVVGGIKGQVGVVTWNGYDTYQQGQNKEVCKSMWWGYVHDGPINCIKRNVFYPDIHLVCGGHIVSIWSLNYKGGPVWWKRFSDFTNSVLWSTTHPAEFRVSFNTSGELQFWNFMKFAHQPYYTFNYLLGDGLIATLSAPQPSIQFVGAERFKFAEGINKVIDQDINELISFSDSSGIIMMITKDTVIIKPNECEEVGRIFQKEVDRRRELDAWNEKYKENFGSKGINMNDHLLTHESQIPTSVQIEDIQPPLTPEQIKKQMYDEIFKWYSNQNVLRTRKMKEKYTDREKRYMIESMMKKKNVSLEQLEKYFKEAEVKNYKDDTTKIRLGADETYANILNELLTVEHAEECVQADIDTENSTVSDELTNTFEKIHQLLVTDIVAEKEKLNSYMKNNPYKHEDEDWAQVVELAEREVRDRLNDPTLLKSPSLRMMRRKLAKKYIDEGYKIKEWKSRKEEHTWDRYKIRESKIYELKEMYGQNYNSNWDKGLQPQKLKDANWMRVTDNIGEHYK